MLLDYSKPAWFSLSTGSFPRFVLVGAVNTAVAFGVFPLLYLGIGDKIGYLPILVFCSIFNPVFSFLTHKFVTFDSPEKPGREFLRYLPFNIGVFFASWIFLHLIQNRKPVEFALAQVLFSIVMTIVAFYIARRVVFRPRA